MPGKQTTPVDEWHEIGDEVKRVNEELTDLLDTLNTIPKSVWEDEYFKATGGLSELKDVLDERFCQEHPDEFETTVFYGPRETGED